MSQPSEAGRHDGDREAGAGALPRDARVRMHACAHALVRIHSKPCPAEIQHIGHLRVALARQERDKELPREADSLSPIRPGPTARAPEGVPTQRDSHRGGTWLQHLYATRAEHSHGSTKGRCSNSSAFSPLTQEELLQKEEEHSFLTPNNPVLLLFTKAVNGGTGSAVSVGAFSGGDSCLPGAGQRQNNSSY